MNRYILLILISASLLTACGGKKEAAPVSDTTAQAPPAPAIIDQVVGIASIEPVSRLLPISAEVGGVVSSISIQANQPAEKGQTILTMEKDVEEAQLRQAKSKFATQEAQIRSLKATRESLKVRIDNARRTLERNRQMLQGGAVTQQVFDDSESQVLTYEKDLETSDANIAQQTLRLKELEADVNYNQTLINRKSVQAPAKGKVLSLDVKEGSIVTTTASLGEFAPEGAWMAITEVDELFADRVQIGQRAYVRSQGGNDSLSLGKVIFVAPYLKKKSLFSDRTDNLEDRRVREVRVQLEDNSKVLIGSRVECVILLK